MNVIISRLFDGFWLNCQIFGLTLLFAIPLGLIISLGSMSRWAPLAFLSRKNSSAFVRWLAQAKPVRFVTRIFVWIIRGTPLMLQLIVIFLGPGLLGFDNPWTLWGRNSRLAAAVVAFVINYACYFSEIYRGGIEAIPKGQQEAGEVLGMTRTQIFFKVTLMQVIKRIIPPMGNEFITLVKDTSLARIIANKEIIMMAQEYISSAALIWPLFSTAVFFLVACGILTLLLNYAEKKLSYFR